MQNHTRKFYEMVGDRYPEDRFVYSTLSGRIRKEWVTQRLSDMPAGSLLDCGCNIGTLSRDWRGKVYGVDIAFSVLARGRKHAPGTNFVQADIHDLGMFKSNSITNAVACEVIEHLYKPKIFFAQAYRVLKRGGHLVVTSPNFTRARPRTVPLGILWSFGVTRGTEGKEYLHTAYKSHELASMAEGAGFRVLDRGSFELELRGWFKPLTIVEQLIGAILVLLAPASHMNHMVERFFRKLENEFFSILDTFGFRQILKKLFKEGRRSYIVAVK